MKDFTGLSRTVYQLPHLLLGGVADSTKVFLTRISGVFPVLVQKYQLLHWIIEQICKNCRGQSEIKNEKPASVYSNALRASIVHWRRDHRFFKVCGLQQRSGTQASLLLKTDTPAFVLACSWRRGSPHVTNDSSSSKTTFVSNASVPEARRT